MTASRRDAVPDRRGAVPGRRGTLASRLHTPMGLAGRLLVVQVLVVGVAGVALVLTTLLVAPGLFVRHLELAGETDPMVRHHAQEAFNAAFRVALGAAVVAGISSAVLASVLVVRRVAAPVEHLAEAADALASGDYGVTVPRPGLGTEFDRLTDAFSGMASRLARTEEVRRRLLADLAHEMRTPLATLEAHLDGLEDGVVDAGPGTWQVLRDQTGRLRRLTDDVRELTAAEEHALSLHLEPDDLVRIARAACQAAGPRYQAKGVRLEEDLRGRAPVHVDAVRIQQVLANLLDNALRHTPQGGSVTVLVRRDGDSCLVRVTDSGAGLPAGELEAVFDRFHRVDPARSRDGGGSGLGLTIARAIVVDHGGSVVAASEGPGTGAAFTVRLPLRVP